MVSFESLDLQHNRRFLLDVERETLRQPVCRGETAESNDGSAP
jgi:hypothetical protein